MNNEERLEKLLENRFDQLTTDEKEFVVQMLGSEEEFEMMQVIGLSLDRGNLKSALSPEPRILNSLKTRMQKNKNRGFSLIDLLQARIPAYVVMLLLIAFATAGILLRPSPVRQIVNSSPVIKTDTVFITRTDTVFRERTVYRQVKSSTPVHEPVTDLPEKRPVLSGGVSMNEKEELNKLLVSGLE